MDVCTPKNAEAIHVTIKYSSNIRDAALNPVRPNDTLYSKMIFDLLLAN